MATQQRLRDTLGPDWRVLATGPAGERMCRYAVIATGTESAAGQGGFGAVMGHKRLKAVAVRGSGGVPIARPAEMLRRARAIVPAIQRRYPEGPRTLPPDLPAGAESHIPPCTYACPRACGTFYSNMPGVFHPERRYSGQVFCCAPFFMGQGWLQVPLSREAGFELAQICNDLGINHWEIVFGLVPWIMACQARGELRELDGEALDLSDPVFWHTLITRIGRREGWGDVLAEGGPRAAEALGVGRDLIGHYYPAWGQASHWDGHGSFPLPYYPYWLVTALQWALDTRDPMGGGHGYTTNVFGPLRQLQPTADDATFWQRFARVGERLYGTAVATDPLSGYEGRGSAAAFHQDRGALKYSLGLCDNIFPLLTDPAEPELLVQADGVEGRYLEHHLFEAASNVALSRDELYRVGARVMALERLLAWRNWSRSRATDETIVPYLRHLEGSVNPYLGEKVALDEPAFRRLLDECYTLRGWNPATALPTEETMTALGLDDLS